MPAYTLQFRVPEALSADIARSRLFWTQDSVDSFVSTMGPRLGALGPVPQPNIELVRLAVLVYAADRSTPRRVRGSNWSRRDLGIEVPVFQPDRWERVREQLQALLGFLSGDAWTLRFRRAMTPKEPISDYPYTGAKRVVLVSGGADSAVGALVSRSRLGEGQHVLVSHVGATNIAPVQREVVER